MESPRRMTLPEHDYRRSIKKRLEQITEAAAVLEQMDASWLYELMRRREQLAANDGYGSSDLTAGYGGSSDTTTTERAALPIDEFPGCKRPHFVKIRNQRRQLCLNCGYHKDEHIADPIGNTVEEVLGVLDAAVQGLCSIPRKYTTIVKANDGRTGRRSDLSDCLACTKPVTWLGKDVLTSGYCPPCYSAWRRFKDARGPEASHVVFRQTRSVDAS